MPFPALLLGISLIAAAVPKERAAKERESLQGEWAAVAFEANGEAVSTAQAGWRMIIKGNRISVRFGLVSFDGNLLIDLGGKQRTLDITKTTSSDFAPGSLDIASIYKREGNRLTVCFRFGQTRPSEFRTRSGMDTMMVTFERAK